MKLTLASNNRAFSRTQWLLIICLAVVAFDFGARYATKKYQVAAPAKTNTVVMTNLLLTAQETVEEEPPASAPITNYATYRVVRVPPTNHYTPRPPGTRTPPGQPEIIDASFPTKRKKLPQIRTNSLSYGIRIAVP